MMKKVILSLAIAVAVVFSMYGQNELSKDKVVLGAGVGIGTALNIGRTVMPPIVFNGEYGIVDNLFDAHSSIGVGACIGFAAGRSYPYGNANPYFLQRVNSVVIGVRGAFHYTFVDRLDTYGGIMLGGHMANVRNEGVWAQPYDPPGYGGFVGDIFLGTRYYVLPDFAVYGELGFGVAYFTVGVSYRIK